MPDPRRKSTANHVGQYFSLYRTALRLLINLVDHEDEPCELDSNDCHTHDSGNPCAVAEARAFLARHRKDAA